MMQIKKCQDNISEKNVTPERTGHRLEAKIGLSSAWTQ